MVVLRNAWVQPPDGLQHENREDICSDEESVQLLAEGEFVK